MYESTDTDMRKCDVAVAEELISKRDQVVSFSGFYCMTSKLFFTYKIEEFLRRDYSSLFTYDTSSEYESSNFESAGTKI